ncbi:hypothetical protein ACO0QE_001214 [Hanseniaspora vineae]
MSSVVNKSGTRFVPKIKQRRVVSQPKQEKPKENGQNLENEIFAEKENTENTNKGVASKDKIIGDRLESPGPSRSISPFSKSGPLDGKGSGETIEPSLSRNTEDGLSKTSTAIPDTADTNNASLNNSDAVQQPRRASVRLDSISSTRRMSVGNRMSNGNLSSQMQQGRLVSMVKKNPQMLSANNDRQLQAMKRRRLSSMSQKGSFTIPNSNKVSKPAKRISIISRASTSSEDFSDGSRKNSVAPNGGTNDDGEDPELKKYRISTIADIPKELTEDEGIKYHIDDSTFTMAELCKPVLPIGAISDNYHIAQEATKKKMEEKKKRRALRKLAREQFKPLKLLTKEEDELRFEERKLKQQELLNAEVPEEEQQPQQQLQLKIGADGNIILDEESTVVDRHANANLVNMHKERQDENTFANLYNTASYSKREYTDPWTHDEEVKLYKALSMWGTDFNLISQLFPYRTRRQVKLKFSLEERKSPVLVELALKRKLPPDFEKFCLEIKQDIGTIEEFNTKLQDLKTKHDEHLKQIQLERETAKQEDNKKILEDMQNGTNGGSYVIGSLDDRKLAGGFTESVLKTYRKSEIVLGSIDDIKRNTADHEAAA